ncbi:MAG TPA: glycosyltransferase family 39 protein [Thermoanaerobaculia bacterium]
MARLFFLLFLFALLVRGVYAWQVRDLPTQHHLVMDARRYDDLARQIAGGDWMPREAFYQAPLYPYFLAAVYQATGGSRPAVRLLQVLLGAATVVLLALAARRLFGGVSGEAAGVIAGVLAALYGPAVFQTPLLLKTTLTLFFEAAFLLLLILREKPGQGRPFLAGLCLGLCALLQENLILLLPVALLWLAVGRSGEAGAPRQRLASALALLIGLGLAMAPAALLNYLAGGELVLTSSQGGMNFFIGNARGATGTYVGLTGGGQNPEQQREDARELAALLASRGSGRPVAAANLSPAEVSAVFWRESLREIREDPAAWSRLLLWKLRLFWNAYEIPDAEGYRVYRREAGPVAWPWIGFGLLAPLGLTGLLMAWRDRRPGTLLLILLTAGVCLSVVLFFVFGRYRLPIAPLLIPPAAYAAVSLAGLLRQGEIRRLAAWGAVLAIALLAVNVPAYSQAQKSGQDAAIYVNLGTAALRWGEEEHAAFLLEMERSGRRLTPEARLRLEQAARHTSEAVHHFSKAVAASPDFFIARVQLAVALHRRGVYLRSVGALQPAQASFAEARRQLVRALDSDAARKQPDAEKQARELLEVIEANLARVRR